MAGLYDGEICNPGLRGRGHLFVIRGLSIARANLTGDPPAKAGIRDVSNMYRTTYGTARYPNLGPLYRQALDRRARDGYHYYADGIDGVSDGR